MALVTLWQAMKQLSLDNMEDKLCWHDIIPKDVDGLMKENREAVLKVFQRS